VENACPECGAAVSDGQTCRDLFYALLVLEGEIAGVPGSILHFYAVATYNLQHPETSGLTAAVLRDSRLALADALDGRAQLQDLLRRARRATNGPARVARRPGDLLPGWPPIRWQTTAAAILQARPATYDAYAELVVGWARSVRAQLDAAAPL
jgi:hypothetical protein